MLFLNIDNKKSITCPFQDLLFAAVGLKNLNQVLNFSYIIDFISILELSYDARTCVLTEFSPLRINPLRNQESVIEDVQNER